MSSERQAKANEQAKQIRMLELQRKQGFSKGRFTLTMGHKYGYSQAEIAEALSYITRLGLTGAIDPATLGASHRLLATGNEGSETFEPTEGYEAVEPLEPGDDPETLIEEADMKPEFGQMPPFTASKLLAHIASGPAGLEVQAALEVMARTTGVSRIAEKGMKDIVQLMHKHGYDAHTTHNKAFYTTQFTKLDEDGTAHSFQMLGWHGTGRYLGGEKTILEFYDDAKSREKPVVSIGVISEANVNPPKQTEVVQHIVDYIKHNA